MQKYNLKKRKDLNLNMRIKNYITREKEDSKVGVIVGVTNLAKEIKVSRNTVYEYIKRGMPYHRISEKKMSFDVQEINTWLKSQFELN